MATMNIDILLDKYKLSQKDLAESTGINKNTISRYCNGSFEKIDKNHIDLICKYFKCTPNDIFEINDNVDVIPAKVLYYDESTDDFTYTEIKPMTDEEKDSLTFRKKFKKSYNKEYKINSFNAIQKHINLELEVDKLVFKFLDKIISFISLSSDVDNTVKKALEIYDNYDYAKTGLIIKQYYRLFHSFLDEYFSDTILVSTLVEINNIYNKGGLVTLSIDELQELQNVINYYLDMNWQLKQKD